MIGKSSLSSGRQIIIWLRITRGLYCLRNDYEQIYSFVNISSRRSYQLTEMSANLRNYTFSEISGPGVECFASFEFDGVFWLHYFWRLYKDIFPNSLGSIFQTKRSCLNKKSYYYNGNTAFMFRGNLKILEHLHFQYFWTFY